MDKKTNSAALVLAFSALTGPLSSAQVRIGPSERIDASPGTLATEETTQCAALPNPLVGAASWHDYRQGLRTYVGVTRDGGETWVEGLIEPPAPYLSTLCGDPMSASDDRTGTLWIGGLSFFAGGGPYAARLEPRKTAFEPTRMIYVGNADKGWMAAGPDPNDLSRTRVYCGFSHGVAVSTDMGDTWREPIRFPEHGFAFGHLPRTGPNGELYVAHWAVGTKYFLSRSFDGGASYDPKITIAQRMDLWAANCPRIPGTFRVHALHGLAVDPNDGALYFVYPDTTRFLAGEANVDVYFTKSTDQGSTWSTPVVINGDADRFGDQFFPWIEVDEQGRVHVIYLDSRNVSQLDSNKDAQLDVYYSFSGDGGATWSEHRLTSSTFTVVNGHPSFLGDYLGMSARGGRVLPVYPVVDPASGFDIHTNVILHGPAQEVCRGILCPCGNDDPFAGCGNDGVDDVSSTGALLSADGSPSVGADDLILSMNGMEPNELCLLLVSPSSGSGPGGDGRLCVGGRVQSYPARQTSSTGEAQYGPGEIIALTGSFPSGFQPAPGETWYYQALYRDPAGPCGAMFNTTNALSVLWD